MQYELIQSFISFIRVAIARTPNNPNNKFAGAVMVSSLYNPHVKGQQHSASRLKI